MRVLISMQLLTIILFFSCKERNGSQNDKVEISIVQDTAAKPLNDSITNPIPSKSDLKVSAYLIYNDGTLSSFDVLNDKTIALWNVIIGGGDALKPSDSTKIKVSENSDTLNIKIRNGRKLVIDTVIIHAVKGFDYIVRNTGCDKVYVNVSRNKKVVYNDSIPFHCGE